MGENSLHLLDEIGEEVVPQEKPLALAPEPLLSTLLREVVEKLWEGDLVMADFVSHVVPPLSEELGHVTAKGGEFALDQMAAGKSGVERYLPDQSMRAHLLNGLFPVLNIARALKAWGAPQFRVLDDLTRRVFIAGYVLHDFLKLPGVDLDLEAAGFSHDKAVGALQMPTLEAIFVRWSETLHLDRFLEPVGGTKVVLHDLIYVACNTQVRWGTLRNLSLLNQLRLSPAQLQLAEDLSRLSDLLAYVIKTPTEATKASVRDLISSISAGLAGLTFHHVADVRGVLTNFIHNASLAAMANEYRVPLLYAPSGVIYLEHRKSVPARPSVDEVAETTIQKIKALVGHRLAETKTGIKRDGKGMKYAEYYWLFFDLPALLEIGVQATFKIIHEGKKPSAGKRFGKMIDSRWMSPFVDLDLPDDIRVDQLGEWCYLAEVQVSERLPEFPLDEFLLGEMGLSALMEDFKSVPRDNRAGGVGYHWYFAAGNFIKKNPGLAPGEVRELALGWARKLGERVRSVPQAEAGTHSDWDDLRDYIRRNLSLGDPASQTDVRAAATIELNRYNHAKRKGRGVTQVCALCSSPYRVDKQREAAVLFAPQVYSNKRLLQSSDAIRDICSICSMEMMIRQILMNRSSASGGDFEGRRMRYLYFYPVYFFTPETLHVVRRINDRLRRLSFIDLRHQLVRNGVVDFSPQTLQRLQEFLLTKDEEFDPATDRYLRLHFPENEPVTFYFIGVPPPSREPKDAEAWVHPAMASLLLPICLDVKVVASESSIPLLTEANEINETVFLDAPHAAIQYLLNGQMRLIVERILPAVQKLIAAYFIHVDAHSSAGSSGFDYRWQEIPALARALSESPLYAFHYLKKWQRKQQIDSLPPLKVRQYMSYLEYLGEDPMINHARELTLLYRQFYRAKRYNSNSILRPLSVATRAILDATPQLFGSPEALTDAVYGVLHALIERAYREKLAFPPKGSSHESQQEAMRKFSSYLVNEVFFNIFRGDKSALRGKQLNLLKNACEVIYLDEAAKDRAEREQVESEAL